MEITFLGTGTSQGIPVIGSNHPVCLSNDPKDKRLRVSVLVKWEKHNILIDCGPDFRTQMLQNPVDELHAILYTHEHNDHTAGLDDIRPYFFKQGNIPIFGLQRVINALKKRFDYIFELDNRYPGAPGVKEHFIDDALFYLDEKEIIPIQIMHGNLPILGYRLKNFAYLTDVKTVSETEMDKLQNVEVLVLNALRKEPHLTHLNLEEALEFIKKINPKRTYLTHISHHMGFHEEVQKELPKNVFLAYDNLKITI